MKKRINLFTFFVSLILAFIIAFMSAYCVTTSNYKAKLGAYTSQTGSVSSSSTTQVDRSDKLSVITSLISKYSYYEVDEEALCKSIIGGFKYVKEDPYCAYYNAEELAALNASNEGSSEGIGVSVIYDTDNSAIRVISVIKDGPAHSAGIQVGDLIVSVIGSDGILYSVAETGYEASVKKIQGAAGTTAKFNVVRDGNFDSPIEFSIVRAAITSESVMYRICETEKYGKKVGVLRITGFDLTTPTQFRDAMDTLIAAGCEYYIFDVRYNPGGDLASITAVLSLMLNKGDTVIITKDRSGNTDVTKVGVIQKYTAASSYYSCNISEEDIGKYRSYVYGKSAVLTNGSTASAAELFTASLKDYGVSVIVGTKTYGKGSMQSIINLAYYGYDGALKLTTKKYFPPISEGYDGIGITPDVTVELDSALEKRNIYDISDTEDNQLQAAITAIK